jgi:hypothetical protein
VKPKKPAFSSRGILLSFSFAAKITDDFGRYDAYSTERAANIDRSDVAAIADYVPSVRYISIEYGHGFGIGKTFVNEFIHRILGNQKAIPPNYQQNEAV